MVHPSFLTEFLIVLVTATFAAVIFERLRLPAILGFLLAGILAGPQGFRLLSDMERIHQLADLGVILLMLTIGLEFSVDRLKGLKSLAFIGGGLQIFFSVFLAVLFAKWSGWNFYQGFLLGSVISLSSTAVVLKYLIDRGELDTHYGRIAVAILIFQDIAVGPLLIFIEGLGQPAGTLLQSIVVAFLKSIALVLAIIVFARFALPGFLHQIAKTRNREIFFLAAIVICLGTAWLADQMGLSLAIGAFLAGFMFANTEYGHQITGEIVPFRHVFVSIFFVSLGLLFDVNFAAQNMIALVSVMGLVLLVNFVIVTLVVLGFGYPPRIAMAAGIILSQIGEFSFLLIQAARNTGGIDPYLYQLLISTSFLTILFTPVLFFLASLILQLAKEIPIFGRPPPQWTTGDRPSPVLTAHIILCGFGTSGRDLAKTFMEESLPFIVLEMNPQRLREAREMGYPVIYGDAANVEVMKHARIGNARAVVVSFADPIGMTQIIRVVQRLNSRVFLVVRTRFEIEIPRLYELGADVVVLEEWEASLKLNQALLEHFGIAAERIKTHSDRIRARHELVVEQAILKQPPKKLEQER